MVFVKHTEQERESGGTREAEITTIANGREQIIVTEIPYQVNKAQMIEKEQPC